jgi:outer membrane lipoprotein-sorting protein
MSEKDSLQHRTWWGALLILLHLLPLGGCASNPENLPRYRWTDDRTALQTLSERAHAIKTLSAASLLTLTRPDGNSVRLDGAIVISMPTQSVRLRAWKFNQPVFDLTLTPAGLWIQTPRDVNHRQQVLPASVSAAQLARAISIFGGQVFDGSDVRVIDSGGVRFQVRKPLENGQTMIADVDRATLTVRVYAVSDSSGIVHLRLTPTNYRDFDGIIWPTRLSAQSDSGKIDVELRDVELNGELTATAFVPPRGAEKAQ